MLSKMLDDPLFNEELVESRASSPFSDEDGVSENTETPGASDMDGSRQILRANDSAYSWDEMGDEEKSILMRDFLMSIKRYMDERIKGDATEGFERRMRDDGRWVSKLNTVIIGNVPEKEGELVHKIVIAIGVMIKFRVTPDDIAFAVRHFRDPKFRPRKITVRFSNQQFRRDFVAASRAVTIDANELLQLVEDLKYFNVDDYDI